MDPMLIVLGLVAAVGFIIYTLVMGAFFKIWLQARLAGAAIPMPVLIAMRLRKTDPRVIVEAYITATKAGVQVSPAELEAHYLAGGDVPRVVQAMVASAKKGQPLSFREATASDLAGQDPLAGAAPASFAGQTIACPHTATGYDCIEVVTSDGTAAHVRAEVTIAEGVRLDEAQEHELAQRVCDAIDGYMSGR